jgi:hypothetical protein
MVRSGLITCIVASSLSINDASRHPKRVRHPDIRGRSKFCTRHDAGASTIVTASRKARVGSISNCPTGKSLGCSSAVILLSSSPVCKNIFIPRKAKSLLHPMPSRPSEGRFAIVTKLGRDAVDADALLTNGAEADGEVVWSIF